MDRNDDNRLKEFRQLKNEIRGSTRHLVVGIDIAKDSHTAFFGTPAGKTVHRGFVFDNTREGFEKLLFQADTLKTREGITHLVFGMEPTADYHKPLGEYLISHGHIVVLVAGTAVKKNRELPDGRWDKHDPKDAANVADLVTQGKCLFYELPTLDLRELRSLLSLKRRVKKSEQTYKVRIRNHLIAQYFPEMDTYFGYGEGPAVVRWCLNPAAPGTVPFFNHASTSFWRQCITCCREGKKSVFTRTPNPVAREKVFEVGRIYCSDITGFGVRSFPDSVFEVERILQSDRCYQR